MKISALVLIKNEQDMIEEALSQLEFADEIIVLDQGSTDNTVQLAKKFTKNIARTKIEDFGKNRNTLAQMAKGQWLLYVDADERFSLQTQAQIKNAVKSGQYSAYYFPRENYILGQNLKHGGWSPDYVPRLFKKADLIGWSGKVHETPEVSGSFGHLNAPIIHRTARSLNLMLAKSIKWAQIEAQLNFKANSPKVNSFKVLRLCGQEFLKRYILALGFLDGKVGFIAALYQALHQAMVLVYLWELQND